MTRFARNPACVAALSSLVPCAVIGAAVAVAVAVALAFAVTATADGAGWPWPVGGRVITPYRNGDDPYAAGQHRGIDIAAPLGAPVRAAAAGTVSFAGRLPDGGIAASVRTDDGAYLVSYLQLAAVEARRGTRVEQGSRLGAVGTTGRRSAVEPHLHFSVRDADGAYVDPMTLLAPVAPEREGTAPDAGAQAPDGATGDAHALAAPPGGELDAGARERVRARSHLRNPGRAHERAALRPRHAGARGETLPRRVGGGRMAAHAAHGARSIAAPAPRSLTAAIGSARAGGTAARGREPVTAAEAAPVRARARSGHATLRAAFFAMAAAAVTALMLRRRAPEAPPAMAPDAAREKPRETAADGRAGDVIALRAGARPGA